MEGKFVVVGVKAFSGTVDGSAYDTCKVNIITRYPRGNPNQLGSESTVALFGNSLNIKKFEGKTFPLTIDCEYEHTTKGIDIYEIHAFEERPKAQPQQQPKA